MQTNHENTRQIEDVKKMNDLKAMREEVREIIYQEINRQNVGYYISGIYLFHIFSLNFCVHQLLVGWMVVRSHYFLEQCIQHCLIRLI